MTKNIMSLFSLFLLTLLLSACGSDGNGGVATKLGMTSIPPSAGTVNKVLFAAGPSNCAPALTGVTDTFSITGGKIHIQSAVAIVNEVEFDFAGPADDVDDPNSPSFAIDLTGNDDKIPNFVTVVVPPGNYDRLKYKIQRYDDDPGEQPTNVADLAHLKTKIGFSDNRKARPSIWVMGVIEEDGNINCTNFKFMTDRRSRISIPFSTTVDPTNVDTTLQFHMETAFNAATSATALAGEVIVTPGTGSKALDAGFLDGRVRVSGEGTTNAKAIANLLSVSVEAYTATTTSTFGEDGTSGLDTAGTTLVTADDPTDSTDDPSEGADPDAGTPLA